MQIMIELWMICIVYCQVLPGWSSAFQTFSCPRPLKGHFVTTSYGGEIILKMKPTITIIILIHNVISVIREIPTELSYSDINLFLNLLWTPGALSTAPRGPLTHIEKHCCNSDVQEIYGPLNCPFLCLMFVIRPKPTTSLCTFWLYYPATNIYFNCF